MVPSANGWPSCTSAINAWHRSTKASWIDSCTSHRVASQQTCPVWNVIAATNFWAVSSTSTSSNTTAAPLPPSSSLTGTRFRPQASPTIRPTSGDPVNDMRLMSALLVSAEPAVAPRPVTTLITPGGNPISVASSASQIADSDVSSAGLMTTVLPAANAGAMPHPINSIGKFQGKMNAQAPHGCLYVHAS